MIRVQLFLAKERIKNLMVPAIFAILIFLAVIVIFLSLLMLILSFHPDLIAFLF